MRVLSRAISVLACVVALAPTAPAHALGVGCATGTATKGWHMSPSGLTVTGAYGGVGFSGSPLCPGGVGAFTAAAACPAGVFHTTVNGAYCGYVVPAGAETSCVWDPMGFVSANTKLVVGFDLNGNGHIDAEWMSVPVDNGYRFKNPYGTPARVIGYPMSTNGSVYPSDTFLVGCI